MIQLPALCLLKIREGWTVLLIPVFSFLSKCELLSRVQVFSSSWTVAHQAPLPLGFSRQEYRSGLAIPFSRGSSQPRDQNQVSCIAGRFFSSWSPGKPKNTGFLLQGIFLTQGSNPHLHWQADSLPLRYHIVVLQCCVSFRCIAKWFSYTCTYTYVYSFPASIPI